MKNRIPKTTKHNEPITVEDFASMSEQQEPLVEHLTIPGFLRRIPHRWSIPEITKFGDQVGRVAEAMQIAYLTAVDGALGVIRVFPVPLLQRVYTVMSPQFAWPPLLTALQDTPRAVERARKQLRVAAEHVNDPSTKAALAVVFDWLDREMSDGNGGEPTPPIRAL